MEGIIFNYLEERRLERVLSLRALQAGAAVAFSPPWDKDAKVFMNHSKAATNVFNLVRDTLFPWMDLTQDAKLDPDEARQLQGRWERVFGSLDSEETKKKLEVYQRVVDEYEGKAPEDARTLS